MVIMRVSIEAELLQAAIEYMQRPPYEAARIIQAIVTDHRAIEEQSGTTCPEPIDNTESK